MEETPGPQAEKRDLYRWRVLALLVCAYMLHHLDRMVLTLLQEPIKHEFNLSDSQLGLITGTAYAVAFGIAGLPLGMLVDRTHRVRLLAVLLTIWSGLTAFAATATSFWTLFLIRIGVGAAESGGTPTNLSLISDYFHKDRRSTAIGIYLIGSQVGTLVGFALTGVVAADFGWRAALLVAGVPGLILVLLLLTLVREPPRQDTRRASPFAAFKAIGSNPVLLHLVIAITVANVVAAGLSSWTPSFLMRNHGLHVGSVGLLMAATIYPFTTLASVLAGLATDRFAVKRKATVFRIMAAAAFFIVPVFLTAVLTGSLWLAMAGFSGQIVLHMFINTPGYAMVMDSVSSNLRGAMAAVLQVASNLIGFGMGPMVGGALSDALKPHFGDQSLRYALAIFCVMSLWPCAHLLRAAALTDRSRRLAALEPATRGA